MTTTTAHFTKVQLAIIEDLAGFLTARWDLWAEDLASGDTRATIDFIGDDINDAYRDYVRDNGYKVTDEMYEAILSVDSVVFATNNARVLAAEAAEGNITLSVDLPVFRGYSENQLKSSSDKYFDKLNWKLAFTAKKVPTGDVDLLVAAIAFYQGANATVTQIDAKTSKVVSPGYQCW